MVAQFHRMAHMQDSRLTKKMFKWDYNLNEAGTIKTWSTDVKGVFIRNNCANLFSINANFHRKMVAQELKSSLLMGDQKKWEKEARKMKKLKTYVKINNFNNDKLYLCKALPFAQRMFMAKIRLGILPLHIETGRHKTPHTPENERVCKVCLNGEIENELHFLLKCNFYSELRQSLNVIIQESGLQNSNDDEKLFFLLNYDIAVKSTGKFIIAAYDKRSKFLFK